VLLDAGLPTHQPAATPTPERIAVLAAGNAAAGIAIPAEEDAASPLDCVIWLRVELRPDAARESGPARRGAGAAA